MSVIGSPAGPAGVASVMAGGGRARRAGPGAGFHVPEESAGLAEVAVACPVSMPSLLAMQEAESGAVQDREARRHGESLLTALSRLQLALMQGEAAGRLQALATLVRQTPAAADPRLAAVQRALLVRVAVELARGRVERPG